MVRKKIMEVYELTRKLVYLEVNRNIDIYPGVENYLRQSIQDINLNGEEIIELARLYQKYHGGSIQEAKKRKREMKETRERIKKYGPSSVDDVLICVRMGTQGEMEYSSVGKMLQDVAKKNIKKKLEEIAKSVDIPF